MIESRNVNKYYGVAAFDPTLDAAGLILGRGLAVARLQAAKAYIVQNSQRPLSVSNVAAHVRVSPRHVQRLFEVDGTTFSAFLRDSRLDHADRMLRDARYDTHTVLEVALDAGFGDISYFNRCFRARFGATPTNIRAAR